MRVFNNSGIGKEIGPVGYFIGHAVVERHGSYRCSRDIRYKGGIYRLVMTVNCRRDFGDPRRDVGQRGGC